MTTISKKLKLKQIQDKKSLWTLKILSGVHIGGEIQLNWQAYKLGSDNDNDIIIRDKNVVGHHLDLELTQQDKEDQICLIPAQGKVKINGQDINQKTVVKNFDLILIGSTFFVIGRNDMKWPQIVVPALVDNKSTQNKHKATSTPQTKSSDQGSNIKRAGFQLTWLLVILILCGVSITSYFLLNWYYHDQKKQLEVLHKNEKYEQALQAINQWVKEKSYLEIKVIPDRHKYIINLTGYIPSTYDLIDLQDSIINNSSIVIIPHFFIIKDMLDQAKSIINGMNIDLEVEYGNNGTLIISGVLLKHYSFNELENKLYESIRGLKAVYDQVIVVSDLNLEINAVVILPHKRYIITSDNRTLREGDAINNSTILKNILHEHLVLQRNKLEIIFDFRREKVRRVSPVENL